ncbi:MAG: D-glycero-D-manno-heptose 1,7-bisphosphate phosphatase [Bacteroidia bacterium]|jgi:D-glycero-D-manno-heptose 1,7-bisphosphate phosphatase
MRKALFLDRDGVLNRERGDYTYCVEDFEILPDVSEALTLARQKGYMLIVISNQGGIAKGIFTEERVELLHKMLCQHLAKGGIKFDEIYYCQHHNEIGKCICRKPNSLMLEKAIARFDINTEESVMIGDSQRDVDAASKAGVKGFLIESNTGILNIVKGLK